MAVKPYSEDEIAFLRQVQELPDDLSLTPEQTALIVGESEDWLRVKRQGSKGAGPDFEQHADGASIRYSLGAVRRWKNDRTFSTTREAASAAAARRFSAFVLSSCIEDEEWFRTGPLGFPEPCAPSSDGAAKMSLGDFLTAAATAARARSAERNAEDIGKETLKGKPGKKENF